VKALLARLNIDSYILLLVGMVLLAAPTSASSSSSSCMARACRGRR
jgi:hypothetical protein